MQQISKSSVKNYILSLKDPEEEGFILQQQYNQSTIMSSAFSILTLELIDCLNKIDIKAEASHISSYQDRSSGLIIDPKLNFDNSNLEDLEKNYIHYQTTAFSISALDALGFSPRNKLVFLDAFRGKEKIKEFFEKIDWNNPWHESNKIMFLLQFFSYEYLRMDNRQSLNIIHVILDQLDHLQDPETGLWGTQFKASSFIAMAAAYHFLIYYKYFDRPINFSERIATSVFQLQMKDGLYHPFGGGGACEDLDAIDVLSKVAKNNDSNFYKSLDRSYNAILKNYNKDGGFCWAKRPGFPILFGLKYLNPSSELFNYQMFKWVLKNNIAGTFLPFLREAKTYRYSNWNEMKFNIQYSDSWSTWFRLLSIAAIEKMNPNYKKHDIDFKFRSIPSIGWLQND
ncbi:MAG: hypothetical protein VYB52_00295 [Candidatus Neomarinimicrobiota bacterium]|nr:hypothetical protein [Candidatus Neomarinimicrobiota bacterium]